MPPPGEHSEHNQASTDSEIKSDSSECMNDMNHMMQMEHSNH